jgi:hypothetical protein
MKKRLVYLLGVSLLSCNMFEKQEQQLLTVKNKNGKTVTFYFVGLGATTDDVIQVRKVDKDNKETLLKAYEHNFLNSAKFVTRDSLVIVLSDTSIYGPSKTLDTIGIVVR